MLIKLRKQISLLPFSFLLLLAIFQSVPSTAEDKEEKADFRVQVSAKEIKNFLDFPDSSLRDFHKVTVKIAGPDGNDGKVYEELYSCKSKSGQVDLIGCKRSGTIQYYGDGEQAGGEKANDKIPTWKIKQKTVWVELLPDKNEKSQEAMKACASALPHLIVELYLNESFPSRVMVPVDSFELVKNTLNRFDFVESDQIGSAVLTRRIDIILKSNPEGMYKDLVYRPLLKK